MPNYLRRDYGQRDAQSGSGAPASGTYAQFDLVENEAPTVGQPLFWICVSGGTPGTWVAGPAFQNPATVTTIAAASNLDPTANLVDIDTGGFNITLTAPTALNNGTHIPVVNDTASPVTFVAGSGTALVAGSAVLAANTSARLQTIGTTWYRA
jgi:hypothetical protein